MKERIHNAILEVLETVKKLILSVTVLVSIVLVYAVQYYNSYNIKNSLGTVERETEYRLNSDIEMQIMKVVDNKLVFTFTVGDQLGSGELIKGFNNRYKYNYAGHGTNEIRERIIETKNGQFLMLTGRNSQSIKHIRAHIEDEAYDVIIPEGEFYLTVTPIKETKLEFTSGMILYNKENQEIDRIKLPHK